VLIESMRYQLDRSNEYKFVFVTGAMAYVFNDICKSTSKSNDVSEDFYRYQIKEIGDGRC
jgi:hypothetical protein